MIGQLFFGRQASDLGALRSEHVLAQMKNTLPVCSNTAIATVRCRMDDVRRLPKPREPQIIAD